MGIIVIWYWYIVKLYLFHDQFVWNGNNYEIKVTIMMNMRIKTINPFDDVIKIAHLSNVLSSRYWFKTHPRHWLNLLVNKQVCFQEIEINWLIWIKWHWPTNRYLRIWINLKRSKFSRYSVLQLKWYIIVQLIRKIHY